jgi:hypothetical protein
MKARASGHSSETTGATAAGKQATPHPARPSHTINSGTNNRGRNEYHFYKGLPFDSTEKSPTLLAKPRFFHGLESFTRQ